MPEGTTFPFSQPHTYDSLTNDYYYCGHTILHPSHVSALQPPKKSTRVWRPAFMLSVSENVYSEVWADGQVSVLKYLYKNLEFCHYHATVMPLTCLLSGWIQLSPEQSAQLHLCHFLRFSLVRFKGETEKHYLGKNIHSVQYVPQSVLPNVPQGYC